MRPIGFGLLALALLAGPALAQPPQDAPIGAAGAALPPLQTDDRDSALADDSGQGPLRDDDRKLHGMVSLGVGTGGYREGAVALNGPLGKDGYFALSVDSMQYQGGRSRQFNRQAAPAPPPTQ